MIGDSERRARGLRGRTRCGRARLAASAPGEVRPANILMPTGAGPCPGPSGPCRRRCRCRCPRRPERRNRCRPADRAACHAVPCRRPVPAGCRLEEVADAVAVRVDEVRADGGAGRRLRASSAPARKAAEAERTRIPSARIHVRFIAVLLFDRRSIYFESATTAGLPSLTSRFGARPVEGWLIRLSCCCGIR